MCYCKLRNAGYKPDKWDNITDCEELRKEQDGAKFYWDSHKEFKNYTGPANAEIDQIIFTLWFLARPWEDFQCRSMAMAGCEYWTIQNRMDELGC